MSSSTAGSSCLPDIPEDVYNKQLFGVVPTTIILVLSLLTYGLRIVSRVNTSQKVGWDDYLMGIGLFLSLEPTICQYLLVANGLGHHLCNVPKDQAARFSKISFALQRANQPVLCCVKISILMFYLRVFSTKAYGRFRIWVYVGIAYTLIWGVVTWSVNLTTCTPIAFFYDRTIKGGVCRNQVISGTIAAVLSLVGDIYVLALPLPALWQLKINTRKKIAVVGIFLLGSFGCVASVIRITEILKFSPLDATYNQVYAATWTTLEQGVAIVSGNLPLLGPLFRGFFASRGNTTANSYGMSRGMTSRAGMRVSRLGFRNDGPMNITRISASSPRLFTFERLDDDDASVYGSGMDDKSIVVKKQVEVSITHTNTKVPSGSILPKPISVARYYYRTLSRAKVIEIDFTPMPAGSSVERETARYALPEETSTPGLRPMIDADVPSVHILLQWYLDRFDVTPVLSEDEVRHYLLFETKLDQVPVVCTYVVEDAASRAITDVVSFSTVPSWVVKSTKHKTFVAACLSYYASAAAWEEGGNLKERLVSLQRDALILATKVGCDVFNVLTIADNPLFLRELDFGAGSDNLYYYFYNLRAAFVPGGINPAGYADENSTRGIGLVTL
ncbi:hypothetical protein diail_12388 [Diaporthe ilicicola]|nr:hypothetical protein diail_12388 [Diaporthe ilicicola]